MGNPSRPDFHPIVSEFGKNYQGNIGLKIEGISPTSILYSFENELKNYFRLCGLSRSNTAKKELVQIAYQNVFRIRILIENSIRLAINDYDSSIEMKIAGVLFNPFFGESKKQGVSLRMPLTTCTPTKLCASACYAHDVLDAAPYSIIRGVLNGWLAENYENGRIELRKVIMNKLRNHVRVACRNALKELSSLPDHFSRRASIRFSHVGEVVCYPKFSNDLSKIVHEQSNGKVDCVVYSRHRNVTKLDPKLWIINFTLDPESLDRRSWAPSYASIVFSAFGGITSSAADINFLEHHRHTHTAPKAGNGKICPATLPETKIRSCDAVSCNLCFLPISNNED